VPTSYTDQFYFIDPFSPPPVGTAMNFSLLTLTDQNDDADFDAFDGDSINGIDITQSYPGDTVTVNVPGVGNVTYTGVTFYLADGQVVFTPNDGQVLQNGTLVSTTWVSTQGPLLVSQMGPPCFVAGTLIETATGPRPVETLIAGDLVATRDRGLRPLCWAGGRVVSGLGRHAPVRFDTGILGNDRPLLVSPQHRVLIEGWQAELLFGEAEVLASAVHLVNGTSVCQVPVRSVSYHHILFDRHEIVLSNGAPTESFFPGETILDEDAALRAEILHLFPELDGAGRPRGWSTARQVPTGREAAALGAYALAA